MNNASIDYSPPSLHTLPIPHEDPTATDCLHYLMLCTINQLQNTIIKLNNTPSGPFCTEATLTGAKKYVTVPLEVESVHLAR